MRVFYVIQCELSTLFPRVISTLFQCSDSKAVVVMKIVLRGKRVVMGEQGASVARRKRGKSANQPKHTISAANNAPNSYSA